MNPRFLLPLAAIAVLSCQEVEQPTTVLTQEQWNEVKQHILETAPEPQHKIGAQFEGKIELIGLDVTELQAGRKATFTWYWKALDDIDKNWKVFVHFDSAARPFRQNLDHVPVREMYSTNRWKKGQVIKDVQEVTLQAGFPAGKATPYIGFWRGDTRMKVSNDVPKTEEAQPRVIGPTLTVTGSATSESPTPAKPRFSMVALTDADVEGATIDGKLDEEFWGRVPGLRLQPLGPAPALNTTIRTFITDSHLYVGAELEDKHVWGTLANRDDETWREEVLEMFLDVDGDGKDYIELQITPLNTIFDARFPVRLGTGEGSRTDQIASAKAWNIEGLESAVHVIGTANDNSDEDTSWNVELRIPLTSIPGLDGKPKLGDEWALNFYRFDRPNDKTTHAYAWSTGPRGDFHQVDKFGIVTISEPRANMAIPKITPEMLKNMRKNVNLKRHPNLDRKNLKDLSQPAQPDEHEGHAH